jgi:coenzyme F420-reducing hydrogenase gamma subunit
VPEPKPKVAVYKFTGCAGCQMELLRLEDELLKLVEKIEIVYFMMAQSNVEFQHYDLCFVEGSVSTPRELEEIKQIRSHTKTLVAFGDCAITGCIPSIKNWLPQSDLEHMVYKDTAPIKSFKLNGIGEYVPVDLILPGCPPHKSLIMEAITSALRDMRPKLCMHAVCMECKLRENVCILTSLGKLCMGPVTRAGCGAICPTYGRECEGCYGPMSDANPLAFAPEFRRLGISAKDLVRKFRKYAGTSKEFAEVAGR